MAAHVSVEFLKATPSIIDRSTCILRNKVFPLLFSFLFMCAFVLQLSCFYLMLMSSGCLAPLAPVVNSKQPVL